MLPGSAHERPLDRQGAFVPADGFLVESGWAEVPVHRTGPHETQGLEAVSPVNLCAHEGEDRIGHGSGKSNGKGRL